MLQHRNDRNPLCQGANTKVYNTMLKILQPLDNTTPIPHVTIFDKVIEIFPWTDSCSQG